MSLVTRQGRPNVIFRRAVRRTWGENPTEVVILAVLREGERQFAKVVGVRDNRAKVLEVGEGAEILRRRPTTVRLADGTEWVPGRVGCSCNVPAQLEGLDPTREIP